MAEFTGSAKLDGTLTVTLSIEEAKALIALTEYGTTTFLNFFYRNLGKSALWSHESGLVSLFESIRGGEAGLAYVVRRYDDALSVWSGTKKAVAKGESDGN